MIEAYLLLYLRSAATVLYTQARISYALAASVDTSVRARVAELERELWRDSPGAS